MKRRLQELQKVNIKAYRLKEQLSFWNAYENFNRILHYQGQKFVPKAISMVLISRHHDNSFNSHFCIIKTSELKAQKYYWPLFSNNIKALVKDCNVCLASKAVRYKPYGDFSSLPILINW